MVHLYHGGNISLKDFFLHVLPSIIVFYGLLYFLGKRQDKKLAEKKMLEESQKIEPLPPWKSDYEAWFDENDETYVGIVSSMPDNPLTLVPNYKLLNHSDLWLFLKENSENWRLFFIYPKFPKIIKKSWFKKNRELTPWYERGWEAEEQKLLKKHIKALLALPDLPPEEFTTEEKLKIARMTEYYQ